MENVKKCYFGERQTFLNIIDTEQDFEEFVLKDGLIVLDVYSGWCGPCFSIIKYLREVFMDYFLSKPISKSDYLHFGLCKVDNIHQLNTFANNCEPTWILLKNAEIFEVIHGTPNFMNLMRSIKYWLLTNK